MNFITLSNNVKLTNNGIVCKVGNTIINLDPKKAIDGKVNFVSHAHADHLPTQNGGTLLSSFETNQIAKLRGFMMQNHVEQLDNLVLVDSGHILGSKGLLADDIFYTGDICTRTRGFLKKAKIPKCKILITECTFGLPEFVFPSIDQIISRVNKIISDLYAKGKPVILLGYQLGKAQTLSQIFGHWEPLYYHDSVKEMNDLHRALGVSLKEAIGHSQAQKDGLLDKPPWLMIAPMMSSNNLFLKQMKSKYGAVTLAFSGWAMSNKFNFGRQADLSIPFSDHCDFNELIQLVADSGAEKIYTIHGFVQEFADHLRNLGFDARPLRPTSLDDFF